MDLRTAVLPSSSPVLGLSVCTLVLTVLVGLSTYCNPVTDEQRAEPRVLSLLADNTLLVLSMADGAQTSELVLGPPPDQLFVGHYMAAGRDRSELFILVRGGVGNADKITVLDATTVQVLREYPLANPGGVFRTIVVGPVTGWLYLIGTWEGAPVLRLLDGSTGNVVWEGTLKASGDRTWLVYNAAITDDESRLFVSYHGPDTTGVDWFTLSNDGITKCVSQGQPPGTACIPAHGRVAKYDGGLLVATGGPSIQRLNLTTGAAEQLDTRLEGNHLMDFAIDYAREEIYAVGSCGYTGGLSRLDIKGAANPSLMAQPRSALQVPAGNGATSTICGERAVIAPGRVLVVAVTARPVPYPQTTGFPRVEGSLTFIDSATGAVIHTARTPAEPVDVMALP